MATLLEPEIGRVDLDRERALVRRRLAAVRGRVRRHLLIEGLAWTFGAVFLLAALSLALDLVVRLNLTTRLGILVIGAVVVAYVAWRRLITPVFLRLSDLDLAVLVDRRRPGVGQRVANVLELPRLLREDPAASPSMIVAAVREEAAELARTDFDSIFADRRRTGLSLLVLAWVGLTLGFVACFPYTAQLWGRRWLGGSNIRWPQHTYLSIPGLDADGRLLAPRGETLLLKIDSQAPFQQQQEHGWLMAGRGEPLVVEGDAPPVSVIPGQINISYRTESGESRQGAASNYAGGEFRYELPPITEPTELNITGGDDWLGPIMIEPIDRPTVASMKIVSTTPGQTPSEPRSVGDSDAQLSFLPQTRLELQMVASEPLASAELVDAAERGIEWRRQNDRTYTATWEMKEAVTLEFHLVGERGGLASKPYFLSIAKMVDREPRLTIRSSGVGRRVTPQAKIPLSFRATDDFGLASLCLDLEKSVVEEGKVKTSEESLAKEELPLSASAATQLDVSRERAFLLRDYNLAAGTGIKLRASALDRCLLGEQTGHSRWLAFQVVTPEELFFEILMRQREQRNRFTVALGTAKASADLLQKIPSSEETAGLLRSHQVVARQVGQIANQLSATLEEMTLNELGTSQARELLANAIITPLRGLHDETLPKVRPLIEALAAPGATDERRAAAETGQKEVVDTMQKILTAMSQWESFVDVVNQLRQVIKLERDVLNSTEKAKSTQTDDVFDN